MYVITYMRLSQKSGLNKFTLAQYTATGVNVLFRDF